MILLVVNNFSKNGATVSLIALAMLVFPLLTEAQTHYYSFQGTHQRVMQYYQSGAIHFFKQVSDQHYVVDAPVHTGGRQEITDVDWKLQRGFDLNTFHPEVMIQVSDVATFAQQVGMQPISLTVLALDSVAGIVKLRVSSPADVQALAALPCVRYLGMASPPAHEEAEVNFHDLSVNRFNKVNELFPNLTGEGFRVSVKERAFNPDDLDLLGRTIPSSLADAEQSLHASQMATIIGGAGNSSRQFASGIVPAVEFASSSFQNLLPDNAAILNSLNISVQNHSYGTGVENLYGAEAAAYDMSVANTPTRAHVFSSGNSGLLTSTTGPYAFIPQFANLTGNMKMAKNILLVGAQDATLGIDERNSKGPTYDGRVAPHLVAYGPGGTSDGAAMVSGALVMLQQYYQQAHQQLPSSALLKAVLAVTADDAGPAGIDYRTGYGALNTLRALACLQSNYHYTGTVASNGLVTQAITVPANIKQLRVAVSWIDPAAAAGSSQALVHDLNAVVVDEASIKTRPWVLSAYPHVDSLNLLPRRGVDSRNTLEYFTLDNPAQGNYHVEVAATTLSTASQDFTIAWWMEADEQFEWTFPAAGDVAEAASSVLLRWDTSSEATGQLEVNIDNTGWVVVSAEVNLDAGFVNWEAPTGFHSVQFRMKRGAQYDASAVLYTSPAVPVRVALNCNDQALLTWDKVDGATSYRIMKIGERYLELFAETTDTSMVILKSQEAARYFAVVPMQDGHEGFRGYSYNYETQGVGCYYQNFLASEVDGNGVLNLSLSTLYNVATVTFEKWQGGMFAAISIPQAPSSRQITFTDMELAGGVSRYRARIDLQNDGVVYSDTVNVYYGDDRSYFVFPNPVISGSDISILSDGRDLTFVLYDRMGRSVFEQAVFGELYRIPLAPMQSGFYLYQFRRRGKPVASGRLLIR